MLSNQEVWSEKIIELQPIGTNSANIIWEWKAWDHLVQDFDNTKDNFGAVNQHPELLNVNYVLQGPPTNSDWLHINSIDFDSATNRILLSSHSFEEFWIIDHSTTTAEAASHSGGNAGKGGDLLYRWGNPITYGRGVAGDHKLFKQHHASFIKSGFPNAGKVLVFNNGVNRPGGNYTSIDIVDISQAGNPFTIGTTTPYLPESAFWTYTATTPTSFYASNIGGVYPLTNGSFIITNGPKGELFEIDSTSTVKWRYTNPVNNAGPMTQGTTPTLNTVFRSPFYEPTYSAFTSQTLTPGNEIELNPTVPSLCSLATGFQEISNEIFSVYPNPIAGSGTLEIEYFAKENYTVELFNTFGQILFTKEFFKNTNKTSIDLPDLKQGIYFLKCNGLINSRSRIIIVN
ncbi:MAG: T9SS type A sorting domain-containing protein [Saprospiraceae bacterium]|uniref:T9SS type A sorting domain-containing protein n=1 Tax=Candidatus Opimibacter skivensis TaxID=2982028 RepID=A0A9D7SU45_9BACT|nr:T9SS type A sorting domain-containing protein [Candidatus Opimibacter skivensis]